MNDPAAAIDVCPICNGELVCWEPGLYDCLGECGARLLLRELR